MPQLSIIVTCYNIEQYLPQCLSSVLAQTLEDIEVIIVDDGSRTGRPASSPSTPTVTPA
jgi:glycosyltransferase involved in cell wall biosynthesis